MPNMKDVAKAAGVSVGTVSNVLSGRAAVSIAKQEKVKIAIQKLGFRPNGAARTLRTNASKNIGLIIPDIENPYYPELARGVEDAAEKAEYSVLLCNGDRSRNKERRYVDFLLEKGVDGIIIVKPRLSIDELRALSELTALVLVDAEDDSATGSFDIVNVEDYAGVWVGMELLYELGHRRIAYIAGLPESISGSERKRAYIDFVARYGLDTDAGLRREGNFSWHSGFAEAYELLSSLRPPTAIVAANDLMALGALKAINERGLSIPQDVSLIGFDDIAMAELSYPALTTIRQPKYEIGSMSVKMLFERMQNREDNSFRKVMLKTELILRKSAGAAPEGKHA